MIMKSKNSGSDFSASWAGSKPGDAADLGGRFSAIKPGDWRRLYDIKHKLSDDGYVDGAVDRIASLLSNGMKEGKKNG